MSEEPTETEMRKAFNSAAVLSLREARLALESAQMLFRQAGNGLFVGIVDSVRAQVREIENVAGRK